MEDARCLQALNQQLRVRSFNLSCELPLLFRPCAAISKSRAPVQRTTHTQLSPLSLSRSLLRRRVFAAFVCIIDALSSALRVIRYRARTPKSSRRRQV